MRMRICLRYLVSTTGIMGLSVSCFLPTSNVFIQPTMMMMHDEKPSKARLAATLYGIKLPHWFPQQNMFIQPTTGHADEDDDGTTGLSLLSLFECVISVLFCCPTNRQTDNYWWWSPNVFALQVPSNKTNRQTNQFSEIVTCQEWGPKTCPFLAEEVRTASHRPWHKFRSIFKFIPCMLWGQSLK